MMMALTACLSAYECAADVVVHFSDHHQPIEGLLLLLRCCWSTAVYGWETTEEGEAYLLFSSESDHPKPLSLYIEQDDWATGWQARDCSRAEQPVIVHGTSPEACCIRLVKAAGAMCAERAGKIKAASATVTPFPSTAATTVRSAG